jgi:5-methyltetrahydrofolate--homocysteine methyltransferase
VESGAVDAIGAFAVTAGIGLSKLVETYEADHDDYSAIMAKSLADRLVEAFAGVPPRPRADRVGLRPRRAPDARRSLERALPGHPARARLPRLPRPHEKAALWRLLDVENAASIRLTENFAMQPAAAVSGFYFAHPDARYFSVGKIGRDQVVDYARRKGMPVEDAERWLRPNLGY